MGRRSSRAKVALAWLLRAALMHGCVGSTDDRAVAGASTGTIRVELGASSLELAQGDALQVHAVVTTSGVVTLYALSFSSSDPGVVAVSEGGFVNAIAPGRAVLTVTATLLGTSLSDAASLELVVTRATSAPSDDPPLELTNLPQSVTSATQASIGYLTHAVAADAVIYCRRDQYAPIVCPNPFRLGFTTPLAAGSHRADFYVGTGGGVDAASPTVSYAWTIAPDSSGAPPPRPDVQPLAALSIYNVESSGHDEDWSGQTITGSTSGPNVGDGLVRTQLFADELGAGRNAYLRRIKEGDALLWSGHRAEFSWYGREPTLELGVDYWFAFAMEPLEDEWPGATGSSGDQQIFFQIHQYGDGDGPTFAIKRNGRDGSLMFEANYDDGADPYHSRDVASLGAGSIDRLLPAGKWHAFIVHLRLGNSTSLAPVMQVWLDGASVLDVSGPAAYMSGPVSAGDYPKIGFYFWNETSYGATPTRAALMSDLYFGEGEALYEQAAASLVGLP